MKARTVTGVPSLQDVKTFLECIDQDSLLAQMHPAKGFRTTEDAESYDKVRAWLKRSIEDGGFPSGE